MEDLLAACCTVCASDATIAWVPGTFLAGAGVAPWAQLPVWVGEDPALAGAMKIDTSRAMAAGLRCRSLVDTVAATYRWYSGQHPLERRKAITLRPTREAELLAAWDAASVNALPC